MDIVFFYIDESGHTGNNLFDRTQPYLYYGVVGSMVNLDILAKEDILNLRKKFGVDRLHAAELGEGKLIHLISELKEISKKFSITFDFYRVKKDDYPVICFFDQVFDQGINPAMTWSGYWTPLRYVILGKLNFLFNEELKKAAWEARLCSKDEEADEKVIYICEKLISRLEKLNDTRLKELFFDVLIWAKNNVRKLSFNAKTKKEKNFISPNLIGFQSVYWGIANRAKKKKRKVLGITVDQQDQFNRVQGHLLQIYRNAEGFFFPYDFGLGGMDYRNIPMTIPKFQSSKFSVGLEIVDIYLWLFKRYLDGKLSNPSLINFIKSQMNKVYWDEVSIKATSQRFNTWMQDLPDVTYEQILVAKKMKKKEEIERKKNIEQYYKSFPVNN
ncbi:DUF3800 domain-containing protein [Acinetobacter nosocomialis]|uniref:DUF3800 domain-containing protein n=1 Tax=Acinetobacter nosocomialis TaxID=106654 RepID=UPI001F1BA0E2|nr:DUF3800 domain-containing protein [Acinetobacter nosocomialis]MCF1297447.1 DUF3800 domain-containing protein [Acinetobacter nosocomialis]